MIFIITKCSLMNLTNAVLKNQLVFSPCSCSMSLRRIKKQKGTFSAHHPQTEGECASQALFSSSCPTKTFTRCLKKYPRDTNLYYYSVQFSEKMRKTKCATEWRRKSILPAQLLLLKHKYALQKFHSLTICTADTEKTTKSSMITGAPQCQPYICNLIFNTKSTMTA